MILGTEQKYFFKLLQNFKTSLKMFKHYKLKYNFEIPFRKARKQSWKCILGMSFLKTGSVTRGKRMFLLEKQNVFCLKKGKYVACLEQKENSSNFINFILRAQYLHKEN